MNEKPSTGQPPGGFLKMLLHLHPRHLPEEAIRYSLTFGLGGMAVLLALIQGMTGLLLKFYYVPNDAGAYDSIQLIQNELVFGSFIRNIHHWSGMLFVLVTFMHLLRVFLTGAYGKKRGANWVIGVILLLIVIAFNFTGYLLPWDQLSYWAVTVCTSMLTYIPFIGESLNEIVLGGGEVNNNTLQLFYHLHTGLLPALIVLFMAWHFWKIRRAGGIMVNRKEGSKNIPSFPNLVNKEITVALVLIATLTILAIFAEAPLGDRANPAITPNPTKAPWYFMGFQEMLLHFHPMVSVVLIPLIILCVLFYLPYIKKNEPEGGIWFLSVKGRKMALVSLISAVVLTLGFILTDDYLLKETEIFNNGLVSLGIYILMIAGGYYILQKRYDASRPEMIQSTGIFLITCFLVMTLVGEFLRGEGMQLIF